MKIREKFVRADLCTVLYWLSWEKMKSQLNRLTYAKPTCTIFYQNSEVKVPVFATWYWTSLSFKSSKSNSTNPTNQAARLAIGFTFCVSFFFFFFFSQCPGFIANSTDCTTRLAAAVRYARSLRSATNMASAVSESCQLTIGDVMWCQNGRSSYVCRKRHSTLADKTVRMAWHGKLRINDQ